MKPPSATLLLVDDTPANLSLLLDALGGAGYDLRIAESGESALAQTRRHVPDLVLLDVMMPGLDGFETCRRLKVQPHTSDVPVIFMTVLDEPAQKIRAFDAGAVDYITKPVHPPEVLAHVRTHLGLRALQRAVEEELALRIDAENQLSQSLDRAVLLVDAAGLVVFSTRLAENLLHKHCVDYLPGRLPGVLRGDDHPTLRARRFAERERDDLITLVLEERETGLAGPVVLRRLGVSPREAEVLYWIAQGKGNAEIGTILGTAPRTIEKHVERIFDKLGVDSRVAAAVAALALLRPA
ncbi:MAG: response regulator [Verrucomicrobia bacterium]|nr:response regulator [Verrucomicrobiota bacterium]